MKKTNLTKSAPALLFSLKGIFNRKILSTPRFPQAVITSKYFSRKAKVYIVVCEFVTSRPVQSAMDYINVDYLTNCISLETVKIKIPQSQFKERIPGDVVWIIPDDVFDSLFEDRKNTSYAICEKYEARAHEKISHNPNWSHKFN